MKFNIDFLWTFVDQRWVLWNSTQWTPQCACWHKWNFSLFFFLTWIKFILQTSADIYWVANCNFREGRRSESANSRELKTVNQFLSYFTRLFYDFCEIRSKTWVYNPRPISLCYVIMCAHMLDVVCWSCMPLYTLLWSWLCTGWYWSEALTWHVIVIIGIIIILDFKLPPCSVCCMFSSR